MSPPWVVLAQVPAPTRRLLSIATTLVMAGVLNACGSTAVTSTAPSPVKCAVTLTGPTTPLPSAGGSGDVTLVTTPECAWTAVAEAAWVTRVEPTSGQGSGTVRFDVAANPSSAVRQTQVVVNGVGTRIAQQAAPCTVSLSSSEHEVPASGAMVRLIVNSPDDCQWTATSSAPWITITAGASGRGSGAVELSVQPNPDGARVGVVTVADQTHTIEQAATVAPGCTYALSPSAQSVAAAGGPAAVSVATGCAWSAVSRTSWITVTSPVGSGPGYVAFVVAANTGVGRTGTITVGSATATVTQAAAAGCSFTLSSSTKTAPATGSTGVTVSVTAPAGCSWTSSSAASWITIVSGNTSTGAGLVTFNVAANGGAARTGIVSIAGQTVTVSQAAASGGSGGGSGGGPGGGTPEEPCTFIVSPTTTSFGPNAGSGPPLSVTAPGGCAWTAASNASWITVTSGAGGNGTGVVGFSVAQNSGPARSGTLTVAGRIVAVSQTANCSYSVSPTTATVAAAGGNGPAISVSAATGCAWAAESDASWLTVTSGDAGNGNGTVTLSATRNTEAARVGYLTIAGQSVTVTQDAGCLATPTLSPTSFGAGGGTALGVVVALLGCSWTATSNVDWITVISATSLLGPGTATFRIDENSGGSRFGTVTLAGQIFTISQGPR